MLISVLMSVYNSEEYLADAIDSILNQTHSDFEFIIVDDGSKDNSLSIIEKYASEDFRIKLIKNSFNKGLAHSLNSGILFASGSYIARQDADDVSALNRLELQMNYALSHPEVDIIGSNCFIIDIASETVYEDKVYSNSFNFFKKLLNKQAIFPHGSAFFNKNKIIEYGMYDIRFYYVQDGELWLRAISAEASIYVMDESLYHYRITPDTNLKRQPAKKMFNRVLQMLYLEKSGFNLVDEELLEIKKYLLESPKQTKVDYMPDYWKSLANSTYLNKSPWQKSFKYISKAIKENNSILKYPKYFFLTLLYFVPLDYVKFLHERFINKS